MTTSSLPALVLLYRPWWQRGADQFLAAVSTLFASPRERGARRAARELALDSLDGLSAATLQDIGAPEWMLGRSGPGRPSAIDPAYWRV